MKSYGPYLLYQIARFGALTVPQILRLCEGKCKRSSVYRALNELSDGGFVYQVFNPATRTKGYYATLAGRKFVFRKSQPLTSGVKPCELDHTIYAAEVLYKLCQRSYVTGVATHFEINPEDLETFCHKRIPDGIIQLTQDGEDFELAVEVEASRRNVKRVSEVLDSYLQTFKRDKTCGGLILVALDSDIETRYRTELNKMPQEFISKVVILVGTELSGIRDEAFGTVVDGVPACLELVRTPFQGHTKYHPINSTLYPIGPACKTHRGTGLDPKNISEVFHDVS